MARTHLLERRQFVPRDREAVFAFFSKAGNLEAITPDGMSFQILTPRPIEMRAGTRIDYRLRLGLLPITWQTEIESFDPPHRFVDVQLRGPYRLWRHLHEFLPVEGGTEVHDRIEYQMPLGPLGSLAHALWVKRKLARIFDFRQKMIAKRFPAVDSGHRTSQVIQ